MNKKIEDMTKEEILKEFEGAPLGGHVPRRHVDMTLLTLRVPPGTKKKLSEMARLRGIRGYTAMARFFIEQGMREELNAGGNLREITREIADATAHEVIERLADQRRRAAVKAVRPTPRRTRNAKATKVVKRTQVR